MRLRGVTILIGRDRSHERNYLELPLVGPTKKQAIYKSKIEYVELNANPILGCSHACRYCYARKIDTQFKNVETDEEWHNPVYFNNFFENLEKELAIGKIDPEKEIFMSTMTDLYQPYAIKYGIGRRLIKMVQQYGCKYRILTKSHRVNVDKEILAYQRVKLVSR